MTYIRLWLIIAGAGLLLAMAGSAQPQSVSGVFSCVTGTTGTACPLSSLEGNTAQFAVGAIVSVSGYHAVADGGAGQFVMLGTPGGSSPVCNGYNPEVPTATGSAGSPNLSFSSSNPTGLTVGEMVTGSGSSLTVQPGSEIASITTSNGNIIGISLTLPLTGTNTSPYITVTIAGNNTGTLILDSYGGAGSSANQCWQKTNYRGDPHEWGALGDGMADDTGPIENWLGAYGNVNPTFNPAMTPPNFGPWVASIPATYMVDTPLSCPSNATIQGDENLTNNGISNNPNPRVNFQATTGFSGLSYQSASGSTYYGTQAVFGALNFCRLSGIAVSGNNFSLLATTSASNFQGTTLNDLSSVKGVQVGNAVYAVDDDGTLLSMDGTVVTAVNPPGICTNPCVTVSQTVTTPTTANGNIFFFGPDAVDVLGQNVTIDGFSLLQNGRYDLFCGTGASGLQVQYTHLQTAMQHGMYIPGPCSNVRLVGNNVSQAGSAAAALGNGTPVIGGDGIYFGATEGSIEGGIIQDSAGAGIRLAEASQMSVTGVDIQGNGTQNAGGDAGPGIAIDSAHTITISDNHFEGNGGIDGDSAQIYFGRITQHTTDDVTLSANVYGLQSPGKKSGNADVAPLYVYDADPKAPLTNIHFYETPARPAMSVFSTYAAAMLGAAAVPQFTQNQISGLGLSNDGYTAIDIQPGSAADSTNSTLIALPNGCTVNFGTSGNGGLDTGAFAPNNTYFIYAIASATGNVSSAPTPSCIASTSPVAPAFTDASFSGSGYRTQVTGGTLNGSNTVFNTSSLSGVIKGNAVWDPTDLSSPTTVSGFSANTGPSGTVTGSWSNSSTTIRLACSAGCTTIYEGMAIQDQQGCFPPNDYIVDNSGLLIDNTITISTNMCASETDDPLSISGATQLVLSDETATDSNPLATLTVATAYYRLIGAINSISVNGQTQLLQFTQLNDTFYLNVPVHDIHKPSLGTTAVTASLNSVPAGVSVEGLGRCVGGSNTSFVILYPGTTPIPPPTVPSDFSTAPGYAVTSPSPDSSFNFRLYTDTSQNIIAQASTQSTTLDCMTDGWVFHR